jgi:hypothetical protein
MMRLSSLSSTRRTVLGAFTPPSHPLKESRRTARTRRIQDTPVQPYGYPRFAGQGVRDWNVYHPEVIFISDA